MDSQSTEEHVHRRVVGIFVQLLLYDSNESYSARSKLTMDNIEINRALDDTDFDSLEQSVA